MNKVKLKSQISGKSIDELFDYQTQDKNIQYFTIENNNTFYKNKNYLESKQLDLNETFNPILFGNEFLFSIEKIYKNNEQKYYFVSKSNYPSLKLSYHNYRFNPNNKERDLPTWISLHNFNYEINEIKENYNIEQRKRKNINYFLKNKKNRYELNVGDVIKLGRVSLIITKIQLKNSNKKNNDVNKNLNNNSNNKVNNNNIIKDIYQEFHQRALYNKQNLKKNLIKKYTINSNEQSEHNNLNIDNNNSIKDKILMKKNDIKNNKFSDKNINKPLVNINKEYLTSRERIESNKIRINNNDEINEKIDMISANNNKENNIKVVDNKSSSEKHNFCRICYCDEEEVNSPLVNICNCSGDIKFIHLKCLSLWLQTKSQLLTLSNERCKQLLFSKINCEICQGKIPEIVFDINKKKTYQVYKPEDIFSFINNLYNNYIILESFELINLKKIIYIISFDEKNSISIGRGQDCDVRLADVTVSRMHSQFLRTKDNKIIIKDAGSKFGTLILLQAKKVLIKNKILSIQIGKIYLNLYICHYNLNCLCKLFNYIIFWICRRKNESKKKDKKSNNNISYNYKTKNDYLNDSKINMININNYISFNDINILDYNNINMKSIAIEDIIDVKYQIPYSML